MTYLYSLCLVPTWYRNIVADKIPPGWFWLAFLEAFFFIEKFYVWAPYIVAFYDRLNNGTTVECKIHDGFIYLINV